MLTKTSIQIIGVVIGTVQGIVTPPLEILQVDLSNNLIAQHHVDKSTGRGTCC